MQLYDYLQNPCRASSLPFWKITAYPVPDDRLIVHDTEFSKELLLQYEDETYFRLSHDLKLIHPPVLPAGFYTATISDQEMAAHINLCYGNTVLSVKDIKNYKKRAVYDGNLWIAVKDQGTGEIAATGIAERDQAVNEGMLEWIQVSPVFHRKGLGTYIVNELLSRMRSNRFATVSGRCGNPDYPEALYRHCGFQGDDVWHVLKQKSGMKL